MAQWASCRWIEPGTLQSPFRSGSLTQYRSVLNSGLADIVWFSVGLLQRLSMTVLFVMLLPIGPAILLFADGDIEALPVAAEWITGCLRGLKDLWP
jgi:hypothetical protein